MCRCLPLFLIEFDIRTESNTTVTLDYYPVNGFLRILFVHSSTQMVVVQNLDPNTRYEFVVRLHVDQVSSPWSSVVYHRTLPAGKKFSFNE